MHFLAPENTLTFIAGLCLSGLAAPWVLVSLMNGAVFHVCIRDVLAPSFKLADVAVFDDLLSPKVAGVHEAIIA